MNTFNEDLIYYISINWEKFLTKKIYIYKRWKVEWKLFFEDKSIESKGAQHISWDRWLAVVYDASIASIQGCN